MSRHSSDSSRSSSEAAPLLQRAPPRLAFFGDPHGDFEPVIRAVLRFRPAAIVLLGDLQARRPLHVELAAILGLTDVWFIHGNHDTDTASHYDHLWDCELAHRNLHGRAATVAGYRVAGLGGAFRASIWDPGLAIPKAEFHFAEKLRRHMDPGEHWREGISLRHRSSIFPDEFMRLAQQRADILVTHEGLGGAVHGQPVLNLLATALGAGLVVHGHLHRDIDYACEGRLPTDSSFLAYGVDQGSLLCWPPMAGCTAPAPHPVSKEPS